MDEPFSNLDRRLRDAVRDETVAILRETGATTVVVTHDPEEAMRIADRIVLMRAGRVVQAGTAEELYRRPGRPRGRALPLRLQRGRGRLPGRAGVDAGRRLPRARPAGRGGGGGLRPAAGRASAAARASAFPAACVRAASSARSISSMSPSRASRRRFRHGSATATGPSRARTSASTSTPGRFWCSLPRSRTPDRGDIFLVFAALRSLGWPRVEVRDGAGR